MASSRRESVSSQHALSYAIIAIQNSWQNHMRAPAASPLQVNARLRAYVRTPASHVTAYPTKSHSDMITRRAVGALRPRPRVQWLK